ncbi:MAG: hypothetical protein QNJ30_24550 [Kiloniellales bacterium]|nr:hypothetical protein [Kiloniellales bacterium]
MKRLLTAAAVLGAGFLSLPVSAETDDHPCSVIAKQRLAELGIDTGDVKNIRVDGRFQSRGQGSRLVGFDAWVALGSCSQGQLVIVMSARCRQMTEFTTGSCKVPGVEGQC